MNKPEVKFKVVKKPWPIMATLWLMVCLLILLLTIGGTTTRCDLLSALVVWWILQAEVKLPL